MSKFFGYCRPPDVRLQGYIVCSGRVPRPNYSPNHFPPNLTYVMNMQKTCTTISVGCGVPKFYSTP